MMTVLNVGREPPHRRADRRVTPLVALSSLVVLFGAVTACGPAAPSGPATASPPGSAASPSTTPASAAPSPSAPLTASARPSGACVDVADLADLGEPVVSAMTGIKPALDAKKVDDARTLAGTAAKGMAAMADAVGPASPQAKQLFMTAASELTQAASQFPSGASLVDQSRHDLDQAFALAQAVKCAG